MRPSACVLALLTALLVAGCKKSPELVGKWTANAGNGTLEVEFKPDNTFTMGSGNIKAKGDYKRDGEKLTLTPKDVEIPGLDPKLLAKAKQSPSFGKPQDATVKFTNDDEISITGLNPTGAANSQSVTLKRVRA